MPDPSVCPARVERVDHPHVGWWIAVIGGMGMLGVLAFHRGAYGWWFAVVTAALSQSLMRGIFVAAVITHCGEAGYALHLARRNGLSATAVGWFAQTFVLGFPSLRMLQRRVGQTQ